MNVFISATPEVNNEELFDVFNILSYVSGPLIFKNLPIVDYDTLDSILEFEDSFEELRTLSFDKLFDVCKAVRLYYLHSHGIKKDDFVVVLTSIKNENNWFSAFKGKNVFIDINDWEQYTGKNQKYGIAYQVVENIFQSLIELNIELGEVESEPNVHWHSIGCINDMCQDKRDIILKLRTADICDSCQNRFLEKGNSIEVGDQIQGITEYIRKGLVRKFLEKGDVIPKKIEVKRVGKIYKIFIDGFKNHIDFEAIERALYIFYLKNLEGVSQHDLSKNYNILKEIYFKTRRGGDENTLKNLTAPVDSSFYKTVCELNKSLNNMLGEALAEFYLLKNHENVYKISLEEKYITIDKEL